MHPADIFEWQATDHRAQPILDVLFGLADGLGLFRDTGNRQIFAVEVVLERDAIAGAALFLVLAVQLVPDRKIAISTDAMFPGLMLAIANANVGPGTQKFLEGGIVCWQCRYPSRSSLAKEALPPGGRTLLFSNTEIKFFGADFPRACARESSGDKLEGAEAAIFAGDRAIAFLL